MGPSPCPGPGAGAEDPRVCMSWELAIAPLASCESHSGLGRSWLLWILFLQPHPGEEGLQFTHPALPGNRKGREDSLGCPLISCWAGATLWTHPSFSLPGCFPLLQAPACPPQLHSPLCLELRLPGDQSTCTQAALTPLPALPLPALPASQGHMTRGPDAQLLHPGCRFECQREEPQAAPPPSSPLHPHREAGAVMGFGDRPILDSSLRAGASQPEGRPQKGLTLFSRF